MVQCAIEDWIGWSNLMVAGGMAGDEVYPLYTLPQGCFFFLFSLQQGSIKAHFFPTSVPELRGAGFSESVFLLSEDCLWQEILTCVPSSWRVTSLTSASVDVPAEMSLSSVPCSFFACEFCSSVIFRLLLVVCDWKATPNQSSSRLKNVLRGQTGIKPKGGSSLLVPLQQRLYSYIGTEVQTLSCEELDEKIPSL